MKTGYLFIVLFFIANSILIAQSKVQMEIESQNIISSNKNLLPLYQYSSKWGIVSPFDQYQSILLGKIGYNLLERENIKLQLSFSGVAKNKIEDSYLHEAYLKGQILKVFDFSIGKNAFTPLSINDELTSGGFMMNSNARPVPKAMIGIFEYWPVSFIGNILEIKGGLTQGILNDDRTSMQKYNSADHVLLHEKWAYLRGGKLKFKPYMGLYHGALYGGERPNGSKIPIDFLATFLAKGSSKIGGGEATNAAGAHDGFWDFGVWGEMEWGNIQFYFQKPFADGSGLKIYRWINKDNKMGILASLDHFKAIKNVSVEIFKTDYQSGEGVPDPIYPAESANNWIIWLDQIEDYDQFMQEEFSVSSVGWNKESVMNYLEDQLNQGYKFGGRDDYNNNGSYYNGWTYFQQPMGFPLYHTYWQSKAYAPGWVMNNAVVFMNNRVKGFHLGLNGELSEQLTYLFKATYSNNMGTYNEKYKNRYSWEEDPDFFYTNGKKQVYTYLDLKYQHNKWNSISVTGSISYDFGELYDAMGASFGIVYKPVF